MSTKQTQIKIKSPNKSQIQSKILHLLEEGCSDKNKIYAAIQNDFDVSKSEARIACKEVKIDLMLKLKVLQSGVLEM
ncbi:hypothetical protein QVH35_08365 [Candidatus Nitrosotenuis chungbukensis]|uniref:hypothetical protein n=1 Tax=Candidatus Nitrosotenuis chungbukensis TaxID=1353246 RepID=UPI0005B29FC5|nr:hypothetical protein [Candidatus Nitrosotenuis chungbukensis]WKT57404.1 hypothetical protein QVH35_08365 [Candidatus Nitrosotenuis chungbukensis]